MLLNTTWTENRRWYRQLLPRQPRQRHQTRRRHYLRRRHEQSGRSRWTQNERRCTLSSKPWRRKPSTRPHIRTSISAHKPTPSATRTTKSRRRRRLDGVLIHRVVPIRRHHLAHGKPASLVILLPRSTSLEMHRCVFAVPFFAECTVALDALGEFFAVGGAESGSIEERIVGDGFAVARGR
jgi:hypothetical protein